MAAIALAACTCAITMAPTAQAAGGLDLRAELEKITLECSADDFGALFEVGPSTEVDDRVVALSLADLNSDGQVDAVTSGTQGVVSVHLGDGAGGFLTRADYSSGDSDNYNTAVGDVNGDGHADVVAGNYRSASLAVFLGRGDGTLAPPSPVLVGSKAYYVALADLNHDEKLDAIVADYSSKVAVLLGAGDGTFGPATYATTAALPNHVAVGDLNNDAHPDVVTANYYGYEGGLSVLLGRGDGTFQPATHIGAGHDMSNVTVGDLNRDGWPDLVAGHSTEFFVFLGAGGGAFGDPSSTRTDVELSWGEAALADFDRDGWLDAAFPSYDVLVYSGAGDGTLALAQRLSNFVWATAAGVGDVNSDGRPDLAVLDPRLNSLTTLLNQASPIDSLRHQLASGLNLFLENIETHLPSTSSESGGIGSLPTSSLPQPWEGTTLQPLGIIREEKGMFQTVLKNVRNHYWSPDGNWIDDSQYDDLTFGPALLLQYGRASHDADLVAKGLKTVEYEIRTILDVVRSFVCHGFLDADKLTEAASGLPSLADAYEHTGNPIFALFLEAGVQVAYAIPMCMNGDLTYPECATIVTLMCEHIGCSTSLGAVAAFGARVAQVTEGRLRQDGIDLAEYALQVADRLYWNTAACDADAGQCTYQNTSSGWAYAQGGLLIALSRTYQVTGDERYRTRAQQVLSAMEAAYEPTTGGYYDEPEGQEQRHLSTNCSMVNALLEMYASTGQTWYLDRARHILSFVRTLLLDADTFESPYYYPNDLVAYHHFTTSTMEHAPHHCIGCNFFLLGNIFRLNQLVYLTR
ncbi:MAG: VCBS repeat-containing protein [Nitrospirae bacterium]|nr:VCBS repeat-containing protein [Nitrospirota bacterium]